VQIVGTLACIMHANVMHAHVMKHHGMHTKPCSENFMCAVIDMPTAITAP
jgi:hypothetical protein